MFWNRKGDMTINIIIGAVIALVVLVVLLFIFTGGMSRFSSACDSDVGGTVRVAAECGKDGTLDPSCMIQGNFNNVKTGQVCCSTADRCRS